MKIPHVCIGACLLGFCAFNHLVAGPAQLVGWGSNEAEQLPKNLSFELPRLPPAPNSIIAAGTYHMVLAQASGNVVGFGFDVYGQVTGGKSISNAVAVSAGRDFSLALLGNGTVIGWGYNADGEATGKRTTREPFQASSIVECNSQRLTNVVAISAGESHALAALANGTIVGWGSSEVPNGLSNIVAVAAARKWGGYDLALTGNGKVFQWKHLQSHANAVSNLAAEVIAVGAGKNRNIALKKDGTVWEWTAGETHATATSLTNVVAIAAGGDHFLSLTREGSVKAWGDNRHHQCDIPQGLSNVVAIAAGQHFSLAITTNQVPLH